MGKKLSPETLESFFDLDRIMNREGLDGPDLDEWFQLCATVSNSLSGPSNAGANERTALRVPMSFPAKIKIGDKTFDGKTRNVSVQGISLSSQSKTACQQSYGSRLGGILISALFKKSRKDLHVLQRPCSLVQDRRNQHHES